MPLLKQHMTWTPKSHTLKSCTIKSVKKSITSLRQRSLNSPAAWLSFKNAWIMQNATSKLQESPSWYEISKGAPSYPAIPEDKSHAEDDTSASMVLGHHSEREVISSPKQVDKLPLSWSQFSYDWYVKLVSHLDHHPHSLLPHVGLEVEPCMSVMPGYCSCSPSM